MRIVLDFLDEFSGRGMRGMLHEKFFRGLPGMMRFRNSGLHGRLKNIYIYMYIYIYIHIYIYIYTYMYIYICLVYLGRNTWGRDVGPRIGSGSGGIMEHQMDNDMETTTVFWACGLGIMENRVGHEKETELGWNLS